MTPLPLRFSFSCMLGQPVRAFQQRLCRLMGLLTTLRPRSDNGLAWNVVKTFHWTVHAKLYKYINTKICHYTSLALLSLSFTSNALSVSFVRRHRLMQLQASSYFAIQILHYSASNIQSLCIFTWALQYKSSAMHFCTDSLWDQSVGVSVHFPLGMEGKLKTGCFLLQLRVQSFLKSVEKTTKTCHFK